MNEQNIYGPAVENWIKLCKALVNGKRVAMGILAPFLVLSTDEDLSHKRPQNSWITTTNPVQSHHTSLYNSRNGSRYANHRDRS